MRTLIDFAGNVAGTLGIALCLLAGFARLSGSFVVADYELKTVFMVGTALMVAACLAKLHLLARGYRHLR